MYRRLKVHSWSRLLSGLCATAGAAYATVSGFGHNDLLDTATFLVAGACYLILTERTP